MRPPSRSCLAIVADARLVAVAVAVGGGFWRYQPERTVRPMAVVVVDELVENVL